MLPGQVLGFSVDSICINNIQNKIMLGKRYAIKLPPSTILLIVNIIYYSIVLREKIFQANSSHYNIPIGQWNSASYSVTFIQLQYCKQ